MCKSSSYRIADLLLGAAKIFLRIYLLFDFFQVSQHSVFFHLLIILLCLDLPLQPHSFLTLQAASQGFDIRLEIYFVGRVSIFGILQLNLGHKLHILLENVHVIQCLEGSQAMLVHQSFIARFLLGLIFETVS
jgi:hypothetical protein